VSNGECVELGRGPVDAAKRGSYPLSISTILQSTTPYGSTLRWSQIRNVRFDQADWTVRSTHLFLASAVPAEHVRFLARAQVTHNDAGFSRLIWIAARQFATSSSSIRAIALTSPTSVASRVPVTIPYAMVLGPLARLGMARDPTVPFSGALPEMSLSFEFMDVPIGEWVAGPWGGGRSAS